MARFSGTIHHLVQCAVVLCTLLLDAARFLQLCLRAPAAVAAENLFLRKQLALYQERNIIPSRASHPTRCTLVGLSQWFDWRPALAVVQPETFQRWRRQRYKLFWRWTSGPGRPPIPGELQALIRQMARDNLTWGQRRIANELRLKLGLRVSPRTVCKYMPTDRDRAPGHRVPSQRWRTFVRNHARALIVRGIAVDVLTRGVQALFARLMRTLQQWWDRSVTSGVPGTSQCDTVAIALLRDTMVARAPWSPETGDGLCVVERSPPDMGSPHHHDPCPATRAAQVDTVVVCPVSAALDEWDRASPHSWGTQSLRHGGTQAAPLQRVA
jgi:hypothetical protein